MRKKPAQKKQKKKASQRTKKYRILYFYVWRPLVFLFFALFDLSIMVALSFLIIFFYAYVHTPSAQTLVHRPISQTTEIYDQSGEHILYKIHGEENRRIIPHDAIPDALRHATVAIEDERFYQHFGIDLIGIARAMKKNFSDAAASEGASTITQQLVRNAFLSREKTIVRKFKEMVLAIKVERQYSKDEILDFYLNEVPYGSNAYGAEAAANVFFNKKAKELTLDEAALLAALPKATTYLSPYGSHRDALKRRQERILHKIHRAHLYDEATMETALTRDTFAQIVPFREEIIAPHFVFYIRKELEKIYTPLELQQGGFRIYTTLDYDMQMRAEKLVHDYAQNLSRYGASNASLVAIDPKTSAVKAMVGSVDFYDTTHDGNVNVALRLRQPGSSFKPIVYAAGYQPETLLHDVVTDFGPDGSGKNYIPQNFDAQTHGIVSMRKALAGSLNIPAVKTLYLVGIDDALDFAQKLGFTNLTDNNRYGLSLVLGGGEVRLLDEVAAFATFANDGKKAPVRGIDRIIGPDGTEQDVIESKEEQVISQDVARKINSILSDNDARAYVFGRVNPLFIPGKNVAAKTGTTQEFRDAWTLGYTPSLAVGVWVGNNDATFMHPGTIGSKVAAPLWRAFMEQELAQKDAEPFGEYIPVKSALPMITGNRPEGGGDVRYYDLHSGKPISAEKARKKKAKDVRVKYSFPAHTILYYVNKDEPLNEELKPNYHDPMLWRWEKAIGNDHLTYP